jgi:hypothetical protein
MSASAKTPSHDEPPLELTIDTSGGAAAAPGVARDGRRADDDEPDEPIPDEDFGGMDAGGRDEARGELQARLAAYLRRGRPRVVLTDNVYTMVTIKRGGEGRRKDDNPIVTFRLHHMFVTAPPAVLRALGRYADAQDREAARVLRLFIEHNDHLVRERSTPRPITVDVEGKHYNLQEIFDELNARYFHGAIAARITWGPRSRRKKSRDSIKLGSYTFEDSLIRIHPVLDAADVPRFFVEWIVYHEMLHEVYDMPVVDGRRVYHTHEFREAEAQFDQYAEAVMWERMHVHKLMER